MAIGCLLQILLPILTQSIVDFGISTKDIDFIYVILCAQIALSIGSAAMDFIRRWIMLHVCMHLNITLLSDFIIKLFDLPMSFFETRQISDLMQRMGDHTRVQNFLTGTPLSLLFSLVSSFALGIVLFMYNNKIFLVFIFFSFLNAFWIITFLGKRRFLNYEMFERQTYAQSKTLQLISSMQEIKLQNCKTKRRWEWEDTQIDLVETQESSLKISILEDIGCFLINSAKSIIITVMSATAVINGTMSFGIMLAIQTIIGQLSSPINQIIGFIYALQDIKISLERINEVRNINSENYSNKKFREVPTTSSLHIENLYFKYDINSPEWTLQNINLDIPSGKTVAIVGASGSGKTTLLKLILGYYQHFTGKICINNIPLCQYNINQWREKCGVVMQEGKIFTDTIANNIAVSDDVPDKGRLIYSTQKACINDYICKLPLGFNTIIGQDGKGLSMGQKQRIMLARAIYKDPMYIFLDEATNSLDTTNEKKITENLSDIFKEKTVLVIAHRLSTIKNADLIVVMDEGRIVEQGKHDYLVLKKGFYYNLIQNQLDL